MGQDHVFRRKQVECFKSNGRMLIWRKPNTKMDKSNLQATVKHGVVVSWCGGLWPSSGVGELVFIDETMEKYVNLNILKQNLLKSAQKLYLPRNFYFQHDRDPKHMMYIVRQWIVYITLPPHIKYTSLKYGYGPH